MSTFICEFCSKNFSTRYTLTRHQETTKRCLDIQRNGNIEFHECSYCDYKSTNKWNTDRHMLICDKKDTNEGLKKVISKNEETILENNKIINELKLENSSLK